MTVRSYPRQSLLAEISDADQATSLPLEHIEVQGQVVGMLASFSLSQRFANPLTEPVELLYRFALPHRASLAGFDLRVGERRIEGQIERREDADALYQAAIDSGQRAALTTEERPNLYTVQIGNVQPGESVTATYRYSLDLELDAGQFELGLPFAVTPRYHHADESPEAIARTAVAIAPPGSPLPALDLVIAIDAGMPMTDPRSPSHEIELTRLDERRCTVKLIAPRVPNKDFVLHYTARPFADRVLTTAWRTRDAAGDTIYAVFVPPVPSETEAVDTPREYLFILDRSGSMSGNPIAQARNALRACLRTLSPADTFRILLFDHQVEWFEPSRQHALAFSDQAINAADAFLGDVEGRGGTNLLPAFQQVAALPAEPHRPRVIILLTDGAISAEDQVVSLVKTLPSPDRVFCFGIGPSVNRYLLDRLARLGRGATEVVGLDEDIEGAIIRFQDRLSYPLLTDLELTLNGRPVQEAYPSPLPDLYLGQPLQVVVRIPRVAADSATAIPCSLRLRGKRGGTDVDLILHDIGLTDEPLVSRLWAQRRIDFLMESPIEQRDTAAIVALSRDFQLLTEYTALLAIDQTGVGTDAPRRKLIVASPLPAGLSYSGFLARVASPLPGFTLPGGAGWPTQARQRLGRVAPPAAGAPVVGLPTVAAPPSLSSAEDRSRALGQQNQVDRGVAGLRELIRAQHASGAWGDADGDSVSATAAAIVAFARAGHTTNRGDFRRPLRRALVWLATAAQTPAERRLLLWAQAEVAVAENNDAALKRATAALAHLGDTPDGLAKAVSARLAALQGTSGAPADPLIQSTDIRASAILGLRWHGPESRATLPMPWVACLGAEG